MLGLGYTTTASQTVTTAQVLLQCTAPADATLVITKVEVGQFTLDTSEDYAVGIRSRATAGTGGTTTTPSPTQNGFPAAGSSWLAGSTAGTGGVIYYQNGANVLTPWIWHPTPEEYILVSPSAVFQVETLQTLTSTTVYCVVSFIELGG